MLSLILATKRKGDEMRIIFEIGQRPAAKRYRVTEEYIRENQRLNRLQRERERAAQNNNSNNGQAAQEKDKGQD